MMDGRIDCALALLMADVLGVGLLADDIGMH